MFKKILNPFEKYFYLLFGKFRISLKLLYINFDTSAHVMFWVKFIFTNNNLKQKCNGYLRKEYNHSLHILIVEWFSLSELNENCWMILYLFLMAFLHIMWVYLKYILLLLCMHKKISFLEKRFNSCISFYFYEICLFNLIENIEIFFLP